MIVPLIIATLKSFLRSRRTLLILFVLPLLLISSIFVSFNPDGLRPVPSGIVLHSGLQIDDALELFDMLRLTEYADAETCLERIRTHREYLCLNVYGNEQVIVELFYDNTREPVIWEVINLLEYKVQLVQRQRSAQAAESLFASLDSFDEYLEGVVETTVEGERQLESYEAEVDELRNELRSSRLQLSSSLDEMDLELDSSRSDLSDARADRDDALADMRARITTLESYVNTVESVAPNTTVVITELRSQISQVRSEIYRFERESEAQFDQFEGTLDRSESRVAEGRLAAADMARNEQRLAGVSSDLREGRQGFADLRSTTLVFDGTVDQAIGAGSDSIVDSVRMFSQPVYVPTTVQAEGSEADVERGFNLLSYQTLFPSLLMLVVLFFGLLLSTFMSITYVKTPAYTRLRLVQGSWFSDFVAMFVSSVLIASVSSWLVFGLGMFLFRIPTGDLVGFAFLLFGILSVLTLLGIAIVHLIWSESMSIIVSMFALVFMLFSSGFILPVERMSTWAANVASVNPVTIGLDAFDRMIFYSNPVGSFEWITLLTWVLVLTFGVLIVRLIREQ